MVDYDSAIATPRTVQVDPRRGDAWILFEAVLVAVYDASEGVAVVQLDSWQ